MFIIILIKRISMTVAGSVFPRYKDKSIDQVIASVNESATSWENYPEIAKQKFFKNILKFLAAHSQTDSAKWEKLAVSLSQILTKECDQGSQPKAELSKLTREIQTLSHRSLAIPGEIEPIIVHGANKTAVLHRGALTGAVFQKLLTGQYREAQERTIRLENFSEESGAFDVAVSYLSGDLALRDKINYKNLNELWLFSSVYNLAELNQKCLDFFNSKFNAFRFLPKDSWEEGFEEILNTYVTYCTNIAVKDMENPTLEEQKRKFCAWCLLLNNLTTQEQHELIKKASGMSVSSGSSSKATSEITLPLQELQKIIAGWARSRVKNPLTVSAEDFFSKIIEPFLYQQESSFLLPVLAAFLDRFLIDASPKLCNGSELFCVFENHHITDLKNRQLTQLFSSYVFMLTGTMIPDSILLSFCGYQKSLGELFWEVVENRDTLDHLPKKIRLLVNFESLINGKEAGKRKEIKDSIMQALKDNLELLKKLSKHKEQLASFEIDFIEEGSITLNDYTEFDAWDSAAEELHNKSGSYAPFNDVHKFNMNYNKKESYLV
jgi:hypothetical protein